MGLGRSVPGTVGEGELVRDQLVVLRVAADPKPIDAVGFFDAQRSIPAADADGPQPTARANSFEMKRRMGRIRFK